MWYSFRWRTDKKSVDEIDTILLIENTIADTLAQKPILQQNHPQMDGGKLNMKFSTLWNCNIISTL